MGTTRMKHDGIGSSRYEKSGKYFAAKGIPPLRNERSEFGMTRTVKNGKTVSGYACAVRVFQVVRAIESSSMATQITANPNVAVDALHARLGRIENLPYTNSMWTQ